MQPCSSSLRNGTTPCNWRETKAARDDLFAELGTRQMASESPPRPEILFGRCSQTSRGRSRNHQQRHHAEVPKILSACVEDTCQECVESEGLFAPHTSLLSFIGKAATCSLPCLRTPQKACRGKGQCSGNAAALACWKRATCGQSAFCLLSPVHAWCKDWQCAVMRLAVKVPPQHRHFYSISALFYAWGTKSTCNCVYFLQQWCQWKNQHVRSTNRTIHYRLISLCSNSLNLNAIIKMTALGWCHYPQRRKRTWMEWCHPMYH